MNLNEIPMFSRLDNVVHFRQSYKDKAAIKIEGDVIDALAIIVQGQVNMQYINEDGQLMTINTFKAGNTFGGNRLFCDDNRIPMTVTAKGNCTIAYVSKQTVLELCQTDQNFLIHFLKDVSSKSDILSSNIRRLKFVTIEEQIIHFLNQEMKKHQSTTFDIGISKIEWSESMGIQRTSLSRALQKMQKKGWLRFKNHHFELLNSDIFSL